MYENCNCVDCPYLYNQEYCLIYEDYIEEFSKGVKIYHGTKNFEICEE